MNDIVGRVREYMNYYLTSFISPPYLENPPKRKVLLIHCHPVPKSFSTEISLSVQKSLLSAGHEVRLRRLYLHEDSKECYNGNSFPSTLTYGEKIKYHDLDTVVRRRGDVSKLDSSIMAIEVKEVVADLRWCNAIVFVYPVRNYIY